MTDTFEQLFAYDPEKSENGVEEIVGVNSKGEDVVFYIAEAGNDKHIKSQRRYAKALESTRKVDTEHEKVIARIIAESILVNWKGVIDEKGKEVKATVEKKAEVLIKYRRLRQKVMEVATDELRFMPAADSEAEVESEKN